MQFADCKIIYYNYKQFLINAISFFKLVDINFVFPINSLSSHTFVVLQHNSTIQKFFTTNFNYEVAININKLTQYNQHIETCFIFEMLSAEPKINTI